jgi:hypothetical protein
VKVKNRDYWRYPFEVEAAASRAIRERLNL